MNRSNLPFILIVIAMILTLLSYDVSELHVGSGPFWSFVGSLVVLIFALILIIYNQLCLKRQMGGPKEEYKDQDHL